MGVGKACTGSSPSRERDKHPSHRCEVHNSPWRDANQIRSGKPRYKIPTIEAKVDLVLRPLRIDTDGFEDTGQVVRNET